MRTLPMRAIMTLGLLISMPGCSQGEFPIVVMADKYFIDEGTHVARLRMHGLGTASIVTISVSPSEVVLPRLPLGSGWSFEDGMDASLECCWRGATLNSLPPREFQVCIKLANNASSITTIAFGEWWLR
jgi:hypothetical protein